MLTDVDNDATISPNEISGPVLSVIRRATTRPTSPTTRTPASDPARLTALLDAAAPGWEPTTAVPRGFLREAGASHEYVDVLTAWTLTSLGFLPETYRLVARILASAEARDRLTAVVDGNWADVWRRIGGDEEQPRPADAVEVLARSGVVLSVSAGLATSPPQQIEMHVETVPYRSAANELLADVRWTLGLQRSAGVADPAHTYRSLLDEAVAREDWGTASVLAGSLAQRLIDIGDLAGAVQAADDKKRYTAIGGRGPWTTLADDVIALRVVLRKLPALEVRRRATELLARAEARPRQPQGVADDRANEAVVDWNVREGILFIEYDAASRLGLWEESLAILDRSPRRGKASVGPGKPTGMQTSGPRSAW